MVVIEHGCVFLDYLNFLSSLSLDTAQLFSGLLGSYQVV